jgi:hypothetical protein
VSDPGTEWLKLTYPDLYAALVALVEAGESKGDILANVIRGGASDALKHVIEHTIDHLRAEPDTKQ